MTIVLDKYKVTGKENPHIRPKDFFPIEVAGKTWLVGNMPNAGDQVFVEGGKNSEGFGGREITFKLIEGHKDKEVTLKGPWHSNSKALLDSTGVDFTDKHLTWGLIAESRSFGSESFYSCEYQNVLYIDDKPTLGEFNRIENLAIKMSNELGKTLFVYSQSQGGSTNFSVTPQNKE